MADDPRKGKGWDFIDSESEAWIDALETEEAENGEEHVDISQYEHFDDVQDLVEYVAGEGEYADTRQFSPNEEDMEMKKREMKNDRWQIPGKLEKIEKYLEEEENLSPNEINLDPSAETDWVVTSTDASKEGRETKYTAHFAAYDDTENGENQAQFYVSTSWYDKKPEEMTLDDLFEDGYQN